MKNRILLIGLLVVLAAALCGCQLALADKGEEEGQDRLVGVLVTSEGLDQFDMMSYLKENLGNVTDGNAVVGSNAGKDQGRLYAAKIKKTMKNGETGETTERAEYVFEGIQGISYFTARMPTPDADAQDGYYTAAGDEAITDGQTGYGIVAGGEAAAGGIEEQQSSISLEGTIYITSQSSLTTYYANPVYQCADGRVYATAGYGNSVGVYDDTTQSSSISEGENTSQTLSANYKKTENGKTKSYSASIKLTLKVMKRPTGIAVLQLDGNSAVLSRTQYTPGELPTAITPGPVTEYIVVETTKTGGDGKTQVTRELYGKDAQFLYTFFCREDGVCVKKSTQINWAKN